MNDGDTWVKLQMLKVKKKKKEKREKVKNKTKNPPLEPCHAMRLGPGLTFLPMANSDYDCTLIATEASLPGEVQVRLSIF